MQNVRWMSVGLMLVCLLVLVPAACAKSTTSDHLVLGNPSNATSSTSNETNYLIQRAQYALSYHRYNGRANWASWHLESGDLGGASRSNFQTDTSLPSGWYRVTTNDYTGSGYDRGHLTPSGDRTSSSTDNQATFLMTNIMPQAPDNNQGPWNHLENYSRSLLDSGNELYIIAGGAGSRGTVNGKVNIPDSTWKVIVVLPVGSNDASRVSTSTRVIAINMPNVNGIRYNDWQDYLTTVDAIEALTGYDLLSNVDPAVQSVIESRVDGDPTPQPTPTPGPQPTPTPAPGGGSSCAADLIISEYVEGSSSNKALELYNGTANTVNLGNYSLKLFSNGSTSASSSATLSGSLAPGQTYVIANSSAVTTLRNKAQLLSGVANFNGDDAVVLYRGTTVIDAFGDVGYDPGTAWSANGVSTLDRTLRRMATVTAGDTNASDNFNPSAQWTSFAMDDFAGVGSHTLSCP